MKICIAQIESANGDVLGSVKNHRNLIKKAREFQVDLIFFPELSITGYEPAMARALSDLCDRSLMDDFQLLAEEFEIAISVGIPILDGHDNLYISMAIFQKDHDWLIYSKQILHDDEMPFFTQGVSELLLDFADSRIAPAICFEALQSSHSDKAAKNGADLYLVSVAKSQKGIEEAYTHFSKIAKKHKMSVLMANSVGPCDNFVSAGQSAVWDKKGNMVAKLNNHTEGLLIWDTITNDVIKPSASTA